MMQYKEYDDITLIAVIAGRYYVIDGIHNDTIIFLEYIDKPTSIEEVNTHRVVYNGWRLAYKSDMKPYNTVRTINSYISNMHQPY